MIDAFFFISVILLALWAAIEDFRHMRIPNLICIITALLFIPYAFTIPMNEALMHLLVAVIVFVVAVGLYLGGLFGGGDAKLLGALALWAGYAGVPSFLIVTTMAGGVVGLIALTLRKTGVLSRYKDQYPKLVSPEDGWLARIERGEKVVPYGIAMLPGIVVTLF